MAGNSAGAYNSIPVNFAKNPGRQRKFCDIALTLSLYHSVGCGFWPKARMASMVKLAAITTVARTPASGKYNNCVDRRGNATLPTNKPRYKPRNKNAATMAWPREPTGYATGEGGFLAVYGKNQATKVQRQSEHVMTIDNNYNQKWPSTKIPEWSSQTSWVWPTRAIITFFATTVGVGSQKGRGNRPVSPITFVIFDTHNSSVGELRS